MNSPGELLRQLDDYFHAHSEEKVYQGMNLERVYCGRPRHPKPPHAILGCPNGCVTECRAASNQESRPE